MSRWRVEKEGHPFKVGNRVEFGGKRGTVRAAGWYNNGAGFTPSVLIAFDDQGDRRPGEPERTHRLTTEKVYPVSAVEQLGGLV